MSTEYRIAPLACSNPIPLQLSEVFSAIEDYAADLGAEAVFTKMRAAVQVYFEKQSVPPAGAEPEVVSHAAASFAGWLMMNREGHTVYEESLQGWISEFLESDDYKLEVSADRAHVARLQAEVITARKQSYDAGFDTGFANGKEQGARGAEKVIDALKDEVEQLRGLVAIQTCVFCNDSGELRTKVTALQSELTKVRELLSDMVAQQVSAGTDYTTDVGRSKAYLARQSAPAACKTPTSSECPGDGVNQCKRCPGAPATKEVRLLSVADDMSTCTLSNGDGSGYFYDRIDANAKEISE